jgi:hypothetical protein
VPVDGDIDGALSEKPCYGHAAPRKKPRMLHFLIWFAERRNDAKGNPLHRVIKIFQLRDAADGVARVLNSSHRASAGLHDFPNKAHAKRASLAVANL